MASDAGAEKAGSEGFAGRQRALFAKGFSFSGYERDMVCLNLGGARFLDVSGVTGLDSVTDGRAAVFGDFDDDGDTDVLLTTIQGPSRLLFRNEVGSRSGWLRLTLVGTKSGSDAYGATVGVKTSAGTLTKVKAGGSAYLSQSDPRLLFGLGADPACEGVEVAWPSGLRQKFGPLPARSSWRIVEGESEPKRVEEKPFSLPGPLAESEASLVDLEVRVGEPFPPVAARALDGSRTIAGPAPKAKRTLVNLWATWCVNCRKEMPVLARLREDLGSERLEIVGLSVDDPADLEKVGSFVKDRRIPYPVLVAESEGVKAIYATDRVTVPLSFLLDAEGKILDIFSGWSPRAEARLRRTLGLAPSPNSRGQ